MGTNALLRGGLSAAGLAFVTQWLALTRQLGTKTGHAKDPTIVALSARRVVWP